MIRKKIKWQQILVISIAWLLCTCAVDGASATEQAGQDQGSYYYCDIWVQSSPGQATMYVSKILPLADSHPSTEVIEAMGKSWTGTMFHKYWPQEEKNWLARGMSMKYGSRGRCIDSWPYGLAALKDMRDRALAGSAKEVDWDYTKDTYVEPAAVSQKPVDPEDTITTPHLTGRPHNASSITTPQSSVDPCANWNPHGLTTAPPAGCSGAIQPPTPVTPYTFCTSQSKESPVYFSAVFETKTSEGAWRAEFSNFLEQKYGYEDPVVCNTQNSPAEAQKVSQEEIAGLSARKSIIQTGWIPGTTAPARAPASASSPAASSMKKGFTPADLNGDYSGSYVCADPERTTAFKLSIEAVNEYQVKGNYSFHAESTPDGEFSTFSFQGTSGGSRFQLHPVKWETAKPPRSIVKIGKSTYDANGMVGLNGSLEAGSGTISGIVSNRSGCTFSAKLDKTH